MSNEPIQIEPDHVPFVATTTPAIERANRLQSLQAHPGFLDLIRISQEMVQESVAATTDYPGWDPQVIVVLKVKQQAATEHHIALLARIKKAIEDGVEEAKAQIIAGQMAQPTAADSIDHGDYVRQRVLEKFEEEDSRVPGSY